MKLKTIYAGISKVVSVISTVLLACSAAAVVFIALLNSVDSIRRYVFGHAVVGASELVSMAMVVFTFGGLCMAVRKRSCIAVPVLTEHMTPRTSLFVTGAGNLLSCIAGGLLTVQFFGSTQRYLSNMGLRTDLLKIPYGPFYLFTTAAMLVVSIELLLVGIEDIWRGVHWQPGTQHQNGEEEAQ